MICFCTGIANGQVQRDEDDEIAEVNLYTGWSRTMQEKHLRIAKNYTAPVVSLRDHTWRRQLEYSYMEADRSPYNLWVQDYTNGLVDGDFTHPNDDGNGVLKDVVQSILSTAISRVPALGSPPAAPAVLPSRICNSLPNFSNHTSFIEGKINGYAPQNQVESGDTQLESGDTQLIS